MNTANQTANQTASPEVSEVASVRKIILIVDSLARQLLVAYQYLIEKNSPEYEVHIASNAETAYKLLSDGLKPDLISCCARTIGASINGVQFLTSEEVQATGAKTLMLSFNSRPANLPDSCAFMKRPSEITPILDKFEELIGNKSEVVKPPSLHRNFLLRVKAVCFKR